MRWTLEEAARGAGFGPHLCPNQSRQDAKHAANATERMGGMVRILDDEQLRRLVNLLWGLPTKRTLQTRVGASDISNPCDRDLAFKLAGVRRRLPPQAEKTWLGKEFGTGGHLLLEQRLAEVAEMLELDDLPEWVREHLEDIATLAPAATTSAETHLFFGHIIGYGDVGGSIDLSLDGQIVDHKGSDRVKTALMRDYLNLAEGKPLQFWVKQKDTKSYVGGYRYKVSSILTAQLSYNDFHDKMAGIAYKMQTYFGQQCLYMRGRELAGHPVDRGSIHWFNRDGNGYWDVPTGEGYADPDKMHDVWIQTFAYSREYAEELMARAQRIFEQLQAGQRPDDFPSHERCWSCSFDAQEEARQMRESVEVQATFGGIAA